MSHRGFTVILMSLVFVAACSSSNDTTTPAPVTPSPTVTGSSVSIVNASATLTTTAFNPNPVTVAVGTTVTWTNNDTINHTSSGNAGEWDSGSMAPGTQFSHTFSTAGTFPYHCKIHPGMVGTLNVQ